MANTERLTGCKENQFCSLPFGQAAEKSFELARNNIFEDHWLHWLRFFCNLNSPKNFTCRSRKLWTVFTRPRLFKRWIALSTRPRLFKSWIALSTGQITIQRIRITGNNCIISWIVIYPLDSAIQRLNNRGQINHYPADKYIWETDCVIHWTEIYPSDNAIHLSNNWGQTNSN